MSNKNKYGLSRTIPAKITEKIRIESGFSCVICGSCPYEYEHIEPEFKDARIHDSNKMTLLCPLCHSKVTKKVFSKELVWQAKKEPWAIKNGHTKYGLDFSGENLTFVLGNLEIENAHSPLTINGIPILSVDYSTKEKSIILNGRFFFGDTLVGMIVNNEWQGVVSDVDIVTVSNRITLSQGGQKIFEFELFPPNKLVVTEMFVNLDNNLAQIKTGPKGDKWFILMGDQRKPNAIFFADRERYLVKGLKSFELAGLAKMTEKTGENIQFIKI